MKQGKAKESAREKRLRKKEFAEVKQQVKTYVLPTLVAVFFFIVAYVYIKSRPKEYL